MARTATVAPAAAAALLLCALLAAQPLRSSAHGMLTIPPARNWLAWINEKFDYPDNNAAGGYKVVGQNGAVKWPHGQHGLCGDVANTAPQRWMTPGPIVATFKAGQTVDLHVLISTNHYGRFEFRLCPANATADARCTKLQRADGKGEGWDLPAIAEGSRFNGGALGAALTPTESDGFYTWYPQPHINCPWWSGCNRYDGLPVYRLRYRLPAGVTCSRCILQWYYISGHKCHPPCLPSNRFFPDCKANPKFRGLYLSTMDYCGTEWASYPEEFWNCADIAITA